MDYEKKYKEALNWMKDIYRILEGAAKEDAEHYFPELKESEDERIRNLLYCLIRDRSVIGKLLEHNGVSVDMALACLEKKGEQNLANSAETCKDEQKTNGKIEPKFKAGDWVVNTITNDVEQIIEVTSNEYICTGLLIVSFDNQHLLKKWTIQDAKDGDVLAFNDGHGNDCIELIKSITGKKIEFCFCLTNGNSYEVFDGITPYTNLASREDATPATKEQRDLLFAKMKEAGYEWDAEKKELKKIERKVAWSEEDKKMFDSIINVLEVTPSESFIPIKRETMIPWLKSIKERYSWKPSDEQMKVLTWCLLLFVEPRSKAVLQSLINDLKKLKG